MIEYKVDYLVNYVGEQKFTGADEIRKRSVILTKNEEKRNDLLHYIQKMLTAYFADANGFPKEWVNVKVFIAVRMSA